MNIYTVAIENWRKQVSQCIDSQELAQDQGLQVGSDQGWSRALLGTGFTWVSLHKICLRFWQRKPAQGQRNGLVSFENALSLAIPNGFWSILQLLVPFVWQAACAEGIFYAAHLTLTVRGLRDPVINLQCEFWPHTLLILWVFPRGMVLLISRTI